MLRIGKEALEKMEIDYPGIGKKIQFYEEANLPACPLCGADNTAKVGAGLIGLTINLASATTKFKLHPNVKILDKYFCNVCEKFFS